MEFEIMFVNPLMQARFGSFTCKLHGPIKDPKREVRRVVREYVREVRERESGGAQVAGAIPRYELVRLVVGGVNLLPEGVSRARAEYVRFMAESAALDF
jgi:hypothetical protein